MKYFVSADIHGYYELWINALIQAGYDNNNPNHKIILCGDLFDRGDEPQEIIDYILDHKNKIILIRGNHEDLIENAIKTNTLTYSDVRNGTAKTFYYLADYIPDPPAELDLKHVSKQSNLTKVLKMCQNYYETEHYIFVHGWKPLTKNWRRASKREWERARWFSCVEAYKQKLFEPDKTIVCGHWHCSALWALAEPDKYDEFGERENFEPFITKDVIALDACTALTDKVNVVVIED